MINGSGATPHCGIDVGSRRERSSFPAVLGGPAIRCGAAFLLLGCLICGLPGLVRGETITRRHLDAGRVQFSGMDLNGDKIPDSIVQDNIKKTITCFLVDQRLSLKRIDPLALPYEERRLIPDVLAEQDLDGDEVRDLLIYNREYLQKYVDNEAVFARLLGLALYIGQPGDIYLNLNGCALTPEARKAIMEKARELVLRNLTD